MFDDALVEAFEARRQQRDGRLGGKLLDERLVELTALGRERDHARRPVVAVDRIECRGDDVDPQHHSRTAAVRLDRPPGRRAAASSRGN